MIENDFFYWYENVSAVCDAVLTVFGWKTSSSRLELNLLSLELQHYGTVNYAVVTVYLPSCKVSTESTAIHQTGSWVKNHGNH